MVTANPPATSPLGNAELLEKIARYDLDTQLRDGAQKGLGQHLVASVKAARSGIDKPHVPHSPRPVFFQLFADLTEPVVGSQDFNRNQGRCFRHSRRFAGVKYGDVGDQKAGLADSHSGFHTRVK